MKFQRREVFNEIVPARACNQVSIGVAPWLADGLHAAGHGHRFEGGEPPVMTIVCQQELTAPDRAIFAKAESVNCDPEDGRRIKRQSVFRHTAGDVRMMMLHFDEWPAFIRRSLFGEF